MPVTFFFQIKMAPSIGELQAVIRVMAKKRCKKILNSMLLDMICSRDDRPILVRANEQLHRIVLDLGSTPENNITKQAISAVWSIINVVLNAILSVNHLQDNLSRPVVGSVGRLTLLWMVRMARISRN